MTLPLFDSPVLMPEPDVRKTLRPYQSRCIRDLRALVLQGKKRLLCVAPTGAGKTVIIASIIQSATLPVLFVAHRKELLDQCARQLADQGITNIGIIRASDARQNPSASVQIGSISTLARRSRPFVGRSILLIADEAHRCASDSWRELISSYPDSILIGFTATPVRLDGRPLGGDLFEQIVQVTTYSELLKHPDWLVAPDVFAGREHADLSSVLTSGSDFDETQLGEVMHDARLEGDVVRTWLARAHLHPVFTEQGERIPNQWREGERRRTIVFAVNVEHSMSMAARFEKEARVAHLDGNTPEHLREAIFRDLACGELEVVTNCLVAIEGIDVPQVKCVSHARPTRSVTMWRQAVGRIMRPWRGVVPILLDHAGNFDRLGCPFEDVVWSLKDRPKRVTGQEPTRKCPACGGFCEMSKTVCPHCGLDLPHAKPWHLTENHDDELEPRQTDPESVRWAFFWRQVLRAKSNGFKPGFASVMYKERYGAWPPRHWSEQVKSEFASDELWQSRLAIRLERKALLEEQERREEQGSSDTISEDQIVRSEDDSFADWLHDRGIFSVVDECGPNKPQPGRT